MNLSVKKKLLVIGPLSSGHLQKWLKPFKDDFEITIITMHDACISDDFPSVKKIVLPRIFKNNIDFLIGIFLLQVLIIKIRPSCLYSSFLSSYGILGAFVKLNCKRVLSVWGTDVNGKVQTCWWLKWLVSIAVKKYDYINAPAEHLKKKLIHLGAPAKKIHVYQYGLDFSVYKKRDDLLIDNELKIISVRNFDDLYNIDKIIKSLSIFTGKNEIYVTLYIAGRGDENSTKSIKELARIHANDKLKIEFKGFLDSSSFNDVLLDAQVVMSIPDMDGTPLSVLESIYVGLIPILSDIDANHEWITKDCGYFVNPNDIEGIVDTIFSLHSELNGKSLSQILLKNRNIVLKNACYEINTKRLKDAILSCIN